MSQDSSPSPPATPANNYEIPLNQDMSPASLYRTARTLQREVNTLEKKLEEVRRGSTINTATSNDNTTNIPSHVIESLNRSARQFAATRILFPKKLKYTLSVNTDDEYNPLERFETENGEIQGQLADIKEVVKTDYHQYIQEDWFYRLFNEELRQQRSNMVARLRRDCGSSVFDCVATVFATSYSRREHFSTLIGLQPPNTEDSEHIEYDYMNIEILHEPYHGRFDKDAVFLNPILIKICATIIYGPKCVDSGRVVIPSGHEVNRDIWQLDKTLPGMIATAAIVAIYTASPDKNFRECGLQSGIKYQEGFFQYLIYLVTGLQRRKASVLRIFVEWDRILFPEQKFGLGNTGNDVDMDSASQSAFRNAMKALNEDDSIDEERSPERERSPESH